jgi:hypothetical protein
MGAQDQFNGYFWYGPVSASLTTSAGNETIKVPAPSALVPTLQTTAKLSAGYSTADVWRPVGVLWTVVTTITVNNVVLTLRKNGVSAATGGTVTVPFIAADATQMFYAPFTAYTFAAGDAVGDKWSVLVTTTSGAGAITVQLALATIRVLGVNEGVAL